MTIKYFDSLQMFVGCCSIRNKLKLAADGAGLPTFVVADAGRTQVVVLLYFVNDEYLLKSTTY